jgi:DNA-nicking Smr family endonuclease
VLKSLLTKLGFGKSPQPPREHVLEPEHDASVEPETDIPETVEIPVDGILDLHIFRPSEARDLVPAYLDECARRGIADVRIIHGKGTGSLRATVHACLARHPRVVCYRTADDASGWGATLVTLDCRKDPTADSA